MSTLLEAIASIERRLKEPRVSTQKVAELRGRLEGLRQRQLNHENLQAEIAKHIGWIEHPDIAAIADGDLDSATQVYGV